MWTFALLGDILHVEDELVGRRIVVFTSRIREKVFAARLLVVNKALFSTQARLQHFSAIHVRLQGGPFCGGPFSRDWQN